MKQKLIRILCFTLAFCFLISGALAYTKLYQGASGSEVLDMQEALNQLGYNLKTDGKYGASTKQAVMAFQRSQGLTPDGVAGNQTLTRLYELLNALPTLPPATKTPSPTPIPSYEKLQQGMRSPQVADMQRALTQLGFTLTADGHFGTATYNAVRAFQRQYGLTVDGIAGTQTLRLLYSLVQQPTPVPTQRPLPTVPVYGETDVEGRVNTTGGSLNLRETQASDARVMATIPNGTALPVLSTGTEWCMVKYAGQIGYVMTKFLALYSNGTAPSLPTPTPAPTQAPSSGTSSLGVAIVNTANGGTLNMRTEPDGSILMRIPNNSVLQLLSRGETWCKVSYQGQDGYVMTQFLLIVNNQTPSPVTPTPLPTQQPTQGTTGIGTAIVSTTGGTLNLRAEASASASILLRIPNTSVLQLLTKGDTWCKVNYNGTVGFVMTEFITILQINGTPAPAPTATPAPGNTGTAEEEGDPSRYTRTLRSGMYGEDVRWVQERLKELKYTVNVTGTYDTTTINAVKAFQTQNGLTADGLAGQQTFAILNSPNARTADDTPLTFKTLRIDDQSGAVTSMQTRLAELGYPVTVNGVFDVKTHNAVVAFQQRNSLIISGIADALTQQVLYGSAAKPYSTPVAQLPADTGKIAGPATSEVKLLHWFLEIKPSVSAGQTVVIFDPATSLSWNIKLYSLGRHADSQPASWQDTQIMNRSFGSTSWTCHPVYVQLPDGRWTLASMHNRPHLYGSINNNGFGGHLCIHFLRDMDEAKRNDPDYGVQNQNTIRAAWKALTGITVP